MMNPAKNEARGDQPAGTHRSLAIDTYYTTASPWFRKADAAEWASVSTSTIDAWRLEGLPYSTVGGTVLIHRDELDGFIREHRARVVARRHRRPGLGRR